MTEIVTGEAVVVDIPVARFPSRMAAVLLDLALQYTVLVVLLTVIGGSAHLSGAAASTIVTVVFVLVIVGYPTIFETLTRGKTLGKMALGLRVVSDDGGPERFRQALVRALAGIFEFTILAPVALITSLVSARGKRLGDYWAGTCVVQERTLRRPELAGELAAIPGPLIGWAQVVELSGLSDFNAEAASAYLRRYGELRPAARAELGARLASAVAAQVSPPPPAGTPPVAYLAAVLAVRRERDYARLSANGPVTLPGGGQAAANQPAAAPEQPARPSEPASRPTPPPGIADQPGFAPPG